MIPTCAWQWLPSGLASAHVPPAVTIADQRVPHRGQPVPFRESRGERSYRYLPRVGIPAFARPRTTFACQRMSR